MAKKYISLSKLSTFLDNLRNTFAALSHTHKLSDLTDYAVDTELSSTSNNPVANSTLDVEFDAISQAMNALDSAIDDKADNEHTHDDRYYTEDEIDTKLATKAPIHGIKTTGTDIGYRAEVEGITSLVDGVSFVMIPHTGNGTTTSLNVNNLGAKPVHRRLSDSTASTVTLPMDCLKANKPVVVTFDGTYWIADIPQPNATDIYGTLDISNGGTGATTAAAALTNLGITATASELNKLDGVTATTTELNYVDGVTSNIQTQLNGKQASITGGASTIASSNLTTNRALISNASGKVAVSAVTSTELGYLDGVTSNIQTQLDGKIPATPVYYSPSNGAKNADDLLDPYALIPISSTSNAELQKILGGTFAYVVTIFSGSISATTRRVQIAFAYNSGYDAIAIRSYSTNGWLHWKAAGGTPLSVGVEIPTGEFYLNKPVYTMLFNGGTTSDGAEIDYPNIDNNTISVIDSRCTIGKIQIPQRATGTWGTADAKSVNFACYLVNQNSITVSCGTGMTGKTIYVQIWYTKD